MENEAEKPPLARALAGGDLEQVRVLIRAGADVRYRRPHGYNALLDAVHSPAVGAEPARLLAILKLLLDSGATLDGISVDKETALRTLSRLGRFDGVRMLLDAGADRAQLGWTSLMQAVVLGSLADVERELPTADLERRDWWHRTAWQLALLVGDIDKAKLLLAHGATMNPQHRGSQPATFFAIAGHHPGVLSWLIEGGAPVNAADDFGTTPLMKAVEEQSLPCVDVLLAAGADVDAASTTGSVLSRAGTAPVARRLLDAGADPGELSNDGRRALLGLPPDPDPALLTATVEEFERGHNAHGETNPERIDEPFWIGMIRSGISAHAAGQRYQASELASPIWCAERFGQSFTFLPDGRVVQIGGEHEDAYMPDFCIYNDVFVHAPDGAITIYGYPPEVFPPTDFHTATLMGDAIYLIGSLGYQGTRRYGHTPVYRVDLNSFRIDPVPTTGEAPGWIYKHRAVPHGPRAIRVWSGMRVQQQEGKEQHQGNEETFLLDLDDGRWRVAPDG
jgi:ankyrin repeat protein